MNTLKVAGKFLDQPILVAKFQKAVPAVLTTSATLYAAKEIYKVPRENRKKEALHIGTIMAFTAASAIAAPKITDKLFKKSTKSLKELTQNSTKLIEEFLKKNSVDKTVNEMLEKAKTKSLKFKEVKALFKNFENDNAGKKLMTELIPDPENVTSHEIMSEIGRLSVFGLIPVAGGILGGIAGDALTTKHWKEKIPDKIKEGSYQYFANIFLCNVGAAGALKLMEKFNVTSKAHRALGMIGGILITGVLGGSAIANLIGNKIINPVFDKHHADKKVSLFNERKPEALDIGLHSDDIATISVMSGLKWIEPALPIMYAISGYRAAIGYRNGKNS